MPHHNSDTNIDLRAIPKTLLSRLILDKKSNLPPRGLFGFAIWHLQSRIETHLGCQPISTCQRAYHDLILPTGVTLVDPAERIARMSAPRAAGRYLRRVHVRASGGSGAIEERVRSTAPENLKQCRFINRSMYWEHFGLSLVLLR